MSSCTNHQRKSSVLGESWVVADLPQDSGQDHPESKLVDSQKDNSVSSREPDKHHLPQSDISPPSSFSTGESSGSELNEDSLKSQSHKSPHKTYPSESEFTLVSSVISEPPELVMPSISFSNSEGSWMVTHRRRNRPASSVSESRVVTNIPKQEQNKEDMRCGLRIKNEYTLPSVTVIKERLIQNVSHVARFVNGNRITGAVVNSICFLLICHLLIFPELVYEKPQLCDVRAVQTLYSSSCTLSNGTLMSGLPSNYQSTLHTQSQLQAYLNRIMNDLEPLENPWDASEAELREVYNSVHNVYLGARQELDFEFEGARKALRSLSRAYNSLKYAIQTERANGSQRRMVPAQAFQSSSPSEKPFLRRLLSRPKSQEEISKTKLLQNQISRWELLLDATLIRLGDRTDSVLSDLATVVDHLESIQQIIVREQRRQDGGPQNSLTELWSTFTQRMPFLASLQQTEDWTYVHPEAINRLRQTTRHLREVSGVIVPFNTELKSWQKVRAIKM